ncbi:MAG: dihydrofolate reductase family protein [Erysipelotrichaceae bacterium]
MRKIICFIAISIDGYIADENGDVSWISGDGSATDNGESYYQFIETVDTVVMGYTTYNQIITELSPENWVYDGLKSYVVTHRKLTDMDNIIFTDEKIEVLINKLKYQKGNNVWICGGASVINQLIKKDLIDVYHLSTMPIILGKGIKLFEYGIPKSELTLKFISSKNGVIESIYEKRSID